MQMHVSCSHPIGVMQKSKLKGNGFGFLEKDSNCTQVLSPNHQKKVDL